MFNCMLYVLKHKQTLVCEKCNVSHARKSIDLTCSGSGKLLTNKNKTVTQRSAQEYTSSAQISSQCVCFSHNH